MAGQPGSPVAIGEIGRIGSTEFYSGKRRTNSIGVQVEDIRICVIMVGLPARGKSLIAGKGTFPQPRLGKPAKVACLSWQLPPIPSLG